MQRSGEPCLKPLVIRLVLLASPIVLNAKGILNFAIQQTHPTEFDEGACDVCSYFPCDTYCPTQEPPTHPTEDPATCPPPTTCPEFTYDPPTCPTTEPFTCPPPPECPESTEPPPCPTWEPPQENTCPPPPDCPDCPIYTCAPFTDSPPCPPCTTPTEEPPPTCPPPPPSSQDPKFTKLIYQSALPSWPIAGTSLHLGINASTPNQDPIQFRLMSDLDFLSLSSNQDIIFTSSVSDGAFVGPNNVMLIEVVAEVIGDEASAGSAVIAIVFPRSTANANNEVNNMI